MHFAVLIWNTASSLASLFGGNNKEIEEQIFTLLRIYCFISLADFSMNFLFRIKQGLGCTWLTAAMNVGLLLVIQSILAVAIIYKFHGGIIPLIFNLYTMEMIAFIIPFIIIITNDWKAILIDQSMILDLEFDSMIIKLPENQKEDRAYSPLLTRSIILYNLSS